MRSQGTLYIKRIAKGWARGWLFVITLMVPWFYILYIALVTSAYSGEPEIAYFMFFGSISVVLFYPGVEIALRTHSAHPMLLRKSLTKTALGWTVPFAILWSLGFWVWFSQAFHVNKLIRSLGIIPSIGIYLSLAALLIAPMMIISRTIGIKVISRQLKDLPEPPAPPKSLFFRKVSDAIASQLNRIFTALIKIGRSSLRPLARAKIGWGAAWILFVWLATQRYRAYGLSTTDFWLYTMRFALISGLLVSIGSGLIAALLMRDTIASWGQTLISAKQWVIAGLLGWIIGLPLGWGTASLYEGKIFPLIRKVAINPILLMKIIPSQQTPILISGIFALIIGYFAIRRKLSSSE
ncbi:MAG: hypothetical protein H8D34_09820 [Chloroflexi bacterium]|nr:hypothetical protein [Chloroflexota bacterium]